MNRARIAVLAIFAAPLAAALLPVSSPAWAPAGSATVHPGVQTFTAGGQCTANFVFQEGAEVVFQEGAEVYLGQAAHCAGTGGQAEPDGCSSGSLPLGTPVEVSGASRPGTLAYSSWLAMQAVGETDPDACAYNDLALAGSTSSAPSRASCSRAKATAGVTS